MSNHVLRSKLIWPGIVFLLSLSGCWLRSQPEHERLEHLVPEHKPTNFASAVDEIQRRGRALFDSNRIGIADESGPADEPAAALAQLKDILGWLPELAAETDLKRVDWENVRRSSDELQKLVATRTAANSESQAKQYLEIVDRLRDIAKKIPSDPPEDQSNQADNVHRQDRQAETPNSTATEPSRN